MAERGTVSEAARQHVTQLHVVAGGLARAFAACGSLTVWRVALTIVSGWTTLVGMMLLYDVFGYDHGGGSIGLLRFVIPISMAGAIHAAIFWALDRWVTMRRRHYFWAIALPLQMLAVGASYGTHWTHMRGASETVGEYLGAQTAIIRGIRSFVQSYQSMAAATASLADHSEKQAKVEAETGTSCGSHAGAGKGPRHNLRMTDRATFSGFNAEISRRRKALEDLVERAEKATAATANDAIGRLGDLRRIVNEAKASPGLARS